MTTTPEVTATSVRRRYGRPYHDVTITCPYCQQNHTHGWTIPVEGSTHRAAHCLRGNGYTIVIPAQLEVTP